jgi:nitrate/nitrite transport system permease protein
MSIIDYEDRIVSTTPTGSAQSVLPRGPVTDAPLTDGPLTAGPLTVGRVVPDYVTDSGKAPNRVTPILLRALSTAGWAAVGIGVLIGAWALGAWRISDLPTPVATAKELGKLMSDPFRNAGPNDQGVLLQLGGSLLRVAKGFAVAVIVGVPFGLLIGASKSAWRAANPIIQLLRPVSPLAWFPIWLITIKNAPQAAVVVIFITALWPIIINTAASAAAIPPDQRRISSVFKFSKRTYLRHVLLPNALPGIVTGMRLSMGVAWMVIVAVEMLSGGSGIGFFVWDAYNALNLARVIAAIVLIGCTGLLLDVLFLRLGRRVAASGGAS